MSVAINITFSLTQHFLCYFPQTHVFIESSIIVPPMLWDLGFDKVNLSHLARRKLSKIPPFSNSAPIFFWLFRKKTQRRGNSFLLKDPFLLPSVSKDSFQQKKWKMIRILVNYDRNLFFEDCKKCTVGCHFYRDILPETSSFRFQPIPDLVRSFKPKTGQKY